MKLPETFTTISHFELLPNSYSVPWLASSVGCALRIFRAELPEKMKIYFTKNLRFLTLSDEGQRKLIIQIDFFYFVLFFFRVSLII
jgi:hypothetical protein